MHERITERCDISEAAEIPLSQSREASRGRREVQPIREDVSSQWAGLAAGLMLYTAVFFALCGDLWQNTGSTEVHVVVNPFTDPE